MDAGDLDLENRAALQRYLLSNFAPAEEFEIREFEVLAGGVSSRTVRVLLAGGQEWVLKQALAKLRVAADWFSDPRRVHREALGMKVLAELTPPGSIPKLIFDDEHHHVLAMEAVPRPHENWKTMLLAGVIKQEHFSEFGALLGMVHRQSFDRRTELEAIFEERSFFESLRVEPYYEYAAREEPQAAGFYANLVADTRAKRLCLVHGDYSPKNVLVHQDKLVLLDHEVIHWGDPAFDVGFGLTHILSKANHLKNQRRCLLECALIFWRVYHSNTNGIGNGRSLELRSIRHAIGCLLARVVGRSPVEYLNAVERNNQRQACISLLMDQPCSVEEFIDDFNMLLEEG